MDAAFRDGKGRYIHQQGLVSQQLEADGVGHIAAALGPMVGACAFSSLAAMPDWLNSDNSRSVLQGLCRARRYMASQPAADSRLAETAVPRDRRGGADAMYPGLSGNGLLAGRHGDFRATTPCWTYSPSIRKSQSGTPMRPSVSVRPEGTPCGPDNVANGMSLMNGRRTGGHAPVSAHGEGRTGCIAG